MENKEEILKALRIIQNVCESQKDCEHCPLGKDTWCMVQYQAPENWKIKSTNIWRAFED